MDQFAAAKARHERKLQKQQEVIQQPLVVKEPQVPILLVPKESVGQDCVIEVKVKLPNKEFVFALLKQNVLSNMSPGRVTLDEFRNAIAIGLEPLMGRVKVK